MMFMLFWIASKTAQEATKRPQDLPKSTPRGPKTLPRAAKRLQEAPKSAPGEPKTPQKPVKRAQDPARSAQKTPKTPRIWRNTIPKTIVHINVADVAEIDKDKTLLTRGAV